MPLHPVLFYFSIRIEWNRDRRDNAVPIHSFSLGIRFCKCVAKTGGLPNTRSTLEAPLPRRNENAGPHTLPWHGPIPIRRCNFARRQFWNWLTSPKVTSSQRHRIVSSAGKFLRAGERRKLFSKSLTNCQLRLRSRQK